MSFGGGQQYILEYVVKVTNQGGTGGISQLNQGFQQTSQTAQQASVSMEKMRAAHERTIQAQMGVTKASKSVAFGFLGMTTAGAEMVGMLSMYGDVQRAVSEAQKEQSAALKEGGKESKAYKDATAEVIKMNRWAAMTQRNLMLSIFDMIPFTVMAVHGMTKMATAMKALKEAKAAEAALNALGASSKGVAASIMATGTSITGFTPVLSKFSKGMVVAQGASFKFTADAVKSAAAMTGVTSTMALAAPAITKTTTAVTGLSKAMRVLQIAAKILIPLIALEVGAQAFANNWGGFADKINAVGAAIGNTIPQLKGMLGWIDKIGRSVVAIFTGDFESIGSIWKSNAEVIGDTGPTDKQRKAIEELNEAILDLNNQSFEIFGEAAMGDKGERKDFLKSFGLDKDARKMFKGVLDDFEEIKKGATGLHNALATMRTLNLMEKFGIDVPNKAWKEVAAGLADVFKDIGKKIPGDDMFDEFAKVMEAASKKKGPAVIEAIMTFMDENPNFLPFLVQAEPELAKQITTMLNEAGMKVDASGMVTEVGKAVKNAFQTGSIIDPNAGEGVTTFDKSGKAIHTKKGKGGGMFDSIVESIKTGVKGLPAQIKAIDWKAVGTAINEKLGEVITVENAKKVGQLIRIYIVDPAYAAAYPLGQMVAQGIKDGWEQFKQDPIGSILGTSNAIGLPMEQFVVGLMGYDSAEEMYEDWTLKIAGVFEGSQALVDLRAFIANPSWDSLMGLMKGGIGGPSRFTNAQSPKEAIEGKKNIGQIIVDYLDKNIAQPLTTAYNNFINHPIVKGFQQLITDPLGFFMSLPGKLADKADELNTAAKGKVLTAPTVADVKKDFGIDQFMSDVGTTYTSVVNEINANEHVVNFKNLWSNAQKKGQEFLDWIWSLGGTQTAEGAGTSDALINSAGGFNAAEGTLTLNIPNVNIVPGITTLPPTLPPLAQNITPTIPTTNAIIKPTSYSADLSGATYSDAMFMGGSDSVAPGSTWANSKAIYIDVPTAVVSPQTVAFDLTQADMEVGVQTFQAIAVEANKTKEFIVNAYNELAATLAELFSTISGFWSEASAEIGKNAEDTSTAIQDQYGEGLQNVYDTMVDLGQQWSEISAEIAKNAEDTCKGITDEFSNMMDDVFSIFEGIAEGWQETMDNMVDAAAEAADDIQSEMDSIKDTESVHTIRTVRVGSVAKGGLMSMASGGIMSAAGGKLLTTYGRQMFEIGDNPGGRESIWAVPHDNPSPTVAKINNMYGTGTGGSGSTQLNQSLVLNIKGNDIINTSKLEKRIRTTIGDKRDRFG